MLAFREFSPIDGISSIFFGKWIGLENFKNFFSSAFFSRVFSNTIIISSLKILFGFPAPIILAIMLNSIKNRVYKKIVQTVSYLPHFLSWIIISTIMYILLAPTSDGLVNQLLGTLGAQPVNFLSDPKSFRGLLVVSEIWKEAGWGSIIYMAAMSGIDVSLYEAAEIDGASRLQKQIHITLPGILPIISIMFILSIGNLLNAGFEQIFLLYSPLVYGVGDIIDTYVYREGLVKVNYSFATSVSLTKSIIALFLIVGSNKLANKLETEGLW